MGNEERKDLECDIVKKLCQGEINEGLNIESAEQYKVLGILCMHRCAGIAYYHLQENQMLSQLHREMRTTLQSIYENNLRKTKLMKKSLNYLAEILQIVDFFYALLKGAKLIEMYPPGTRTSNDIDILINRQDIPKITKLLLGNDFEQGYIRNNQFYKATRRDIVNALLNRGETTPFVKQVDWDNMKYLEIDVNISVDETSNDKSNVVKTMLEHAVPQLQTENGKLYTLDPVDFLIHLCTHLYKEASVYQWVQMGRDLSLYKFLDIYTYWKSCLKEEYIPILKRRVEKYGVREPVYYSLHCTNELWNFQDEGLTSFLEGLFVVNQEVINRVYNPETKRVYRYRDVFEDRVFNERHKDSLEEIQG